MKYIITIFFFGLISCNNARYITTNSIRQIDIKGSAKFVSEKTISVLIDSNWIVTIDSANFEETEFENYYLDKQGLILKCESFDQDSLRKYTQKYKYSNSGKLVKINVYKNEKLIEYVEFNYFGKYFLKTKTFDTESGKLTTIYKMKYDDDLIVKKNIRNKLTNSKQLYTYEYDNVGNMIRMTRRSDYYDGNEYLIFKYLKFDSHENWTERFAYDTDEGETGSLTIRNVIYN